jgi:hypothetical protein
LALLQFYYWPVLGKGPSPDPNQGMLLEPLTLSFALQRNLEIALGLNAGELGQRRTMPPIFPGPHFQAMGLNDQDQVLARIMWSSGQVYGVFSPTPIPEASTLALLASVLAAIALAHNRKVLR